eukprot:5022022-Alexandrium_andersonii.AAC.1
MRRGYAASAALPDMVHSRAEGPRPYAPRGDAAAFEQWNIDQRERVLARPGAYHCCDWCGSPRWVPHDAMTGNLK